MGTLTINDKYTIKYITYEDGVIVLNGTARFGMNDELTKVDNGEALKDGVKVGEWTAYRAEERMKLSMSNFEATDLAVVLPVINECVAALEVEE